MSFARYGKLLFRFARNTRDLRRRDQSFAGEFAAVDDALRRAGIGIGDLVDIAASDGVEKSPTLPLFKRGWRGVAVEMDPDSFALFAGVYIRFPAVRLARCRVTPDNVGALLAANEMPLCFDLLNLDIDSYDLPVLNGILKKGYRPKVISMEINEKIPAGINFSVRFDEEHYWQGDHFYGCSLGAAVVVLKPQDYLLANVAYNNAIFIAREVARDVEDLDEHAAYKAGYLDRPDRKKLFPWNADMEDLQTMPVDEAIRAIERRFAKYGGKFDISD